MKTVVCTDVPHLVKTVGRTPLDIVTKEHCGLVVVINLAIILLYIGICFYR